MHWYASNGTTWLGSVSNLGPTIGTSGEFIRKGARVNAPPNAEYAKIALEVNDAGTAWFDSIQFELGSVINQYNLVYNESFEIDMDMDTLPDGWEKWEGSVGDVNDGVVTTYARTGARSIVLHGDTQKNKLLRQVIDLKGEAGTPIYFSGWSKAEGVSTGGNYQILIQIRYETLGLVPYGQDFRKTTHDWEFAERVIVTTDKFNSIEIYAKLQNQTGRAWFDDFTVRLAGAPNALMSKYNLAQNGNFENDKISPLGWPDEWTAFNNNAQTPGTYSIQWLESDGGIKSFSDMRMVKISNVPDWAVVANEIYEPMQAGVTYTASGVIKTVNVTESGAVVKFDILDANNQYLGQKLSKVITGTTDWTRVAVTINLNEARTIHPNAAKLKVAAGTVGATNGSMYFDAVRMFNENVEIKYIYDTNRNYIKSITNQLGNTMYLERDNRGNVTQVTDSKNNISIFEYNGLDLIRRVDNPKGLRQTFSYDNNGNLKRIDNYTTGDVYISTNIWYDYNELGLPRMISDINWLNWRNTLLKYNANGGLTEIAYPNGKKILYNYDGADRMIEKTYVGDATKWNFEYDANDNLEYILKNNAKTIKYIYDELDRLTQKQYLAADLTVINSSSYGYTPMSEILNLSDVIGPRTLQTSFTYDYAGNNVDVLGPASTETSFIYDEERKIKKVFVKAGNMHYITYRDYDALGQVTRLRTENNLGSNIIDFIYEYDKNGNRTKEIDNIGKSRVEYSYDSINQLEEERYYSDLTTTITNKKLTYRYDLLGNRLQKIINDSSTIPYAYNKSNEITHINTNPVYVHDTNGNLTNITDSGWTYIYNPENQLIRVEKSGQMVATYEYNGEGLRVRKVTPVRAERYYYNGDKLAYITDDNNRLRYYFTRDTQGRLLHMLDCYDLSGVIDVYWYHYDAHGNVIGLWDKNGVKVVNYSYDAWGNILSPASSAQTRDGVPLSEANPFRFSSYQYDKETEFYYLKARYYSPYLGRFITKDPILRTNQYTYAGNNPVNFIDPNGMLEIVDDNTVYYPRTGVMQNYKTGEIVRRIKPARPRKHIKNKSISKIEDMDLKGVDLSGGFYGFGGGIKGGMQRLDNGKQDIIVFYGALGSNVGNASGGGFSGAIVKYNTSDPNKLKGLSWDMGGDVSYGGVTAGYSTLVGPGVIGHVYGGGPGAYLLGLNTHAMPAWAWVLAFDKISPESLELIRQRRRK